MTKLLTVENHKTPKGEKSGWLTGILYLASSTIAGKGINVCPCADDGCKAACLYTAGRGRFKKIQKARIRKTRLLFSDRLGFVQQLDKDIESLKRKAKRKNMKLAIRLNGTSDLPWHTEAYGALPSKHPEVQFYDYTSVLRSIEQDRPKNYHLTFSRHTNNADDCVKALKLGVNVAAVFEKAPESCQGYLVTSGDDNDLRFLDPSPCVVALTPKGRAKHDSTGFVIR
jgi:hypothetical protein